MSDGQAQIGNCWYGTFNFHTRSEPDLNPCLGERAQVSFFISGSILLFVRPLVVFSSDPIVPSLPPSPSLDAGHTGPVTEQPSIGAVDTRGRRRANYPSSTQDPSSAPPAVPNARKQHRGGRRNNPLSRSATGNEQTQRDADTDRSANPVREADDNPTSRN
ncbi:hypothetical protein MSAN_01841600 [Mycena sanguinolenta]|uniref:Uncharacterized protein n=1 Tax=Mycena sanguinolenta TaxID=230812 RepID=A0A8H6XRH0_9AGAR|nr:hypothetical protein MSAN_01841600 [Mycena sanguinolenta]